MKVQEKSSDYLVNSQATQWQQGTLGELLPIKYGKSLPEKLRDTTGSHPVFGSSGQVGTHSAALTAGPTLIIGRKGNVGAIHYSSEACWPIDTVYYVEPPEGQNLRYYKYLLESLNLVKLDKSTAVPGLSRDDYNAVKVVVAPPEQQDEIVAEIEKQFSRLDEAVANLKRVKANLKRYKAAVLKAAVEGRLVETEAELARREGRSYETGAQLLQRILETRRSQWQGKGKYKEPAAPDTTDLPELPEGWVWATVDSLCEQIVDCPHSTARFQAEGFPCIDTTWMTTEGLAIERARYVDQSIYQERIARLEPKPGDIVFAREGTIGTAILIPERMKPCLGQRVMLLRASALFLNSLLRHMLHSETIKTQYRAQALGSTVPHINVGDVKAFSVPVPPLAEQHRIVAEIERCLSFAGALDIEVDANRTRALSLYQSVLKQSFNSGNVPCEF